MLKQQREKFSTGLCSSFIGSMKELNDLINMDIYFGVSAISLWSGKKLNVVREILLDRLVL